MFNRIIFFSLKNRFFVVLLGLLIATAGVLTVPRMSIDVLPDLNRPMVVIMTEAHAMVPEDVEQLITLPLEQVLNGATGVSRVRSGSGLGLSVVIVEFDWGTDVYRNRQIVQEKLQLSKSRLPGDVEPTMAPISSIMGQIQLIGMYSKDGTNSTSEIRALADYDVRYRLLSIPGISKVITTGGAPRQLQVILDSEKLRTFEVSVEDVAEALRGSNRNASGGFLNVGENAPVITVRGLVSNKEQLGEAIVRADTIRPVRVRDVGKVTFGPALIRTGDAGVNGKSGVIVVVMKQPGFDTVQLTGEVDKALVELKKSFPEDVEVVSDLFLQASFIHRAIDNVSAAVRDGAILVVIILFVFLLNFRTTFITLTAIPMAIAITALIFAAFGLGINSMTLGGIAVAVGTLVDDAIVNVENIFKRLKENSLLPESERRAAIKVVFEASCEVRNAVIMSTLFVFAVYLPLFFLSGLEGKLFIPIGVAFMISVGASTLVAITLTPALCYYLLPNYLQKKERPDGPVIRNGKAVAGWVIRKSAENARLVLTTAAAAVVIGLAILWTRGTEFLPEFNEGVAQILLVLPPEVSIETSDRYGRRMANLLIDIDGVQSVARRSGRAEGDEHAEGVNISEAIVNFDTESERSRAEMLKEIRAKMAKEFPGVGVAVDQPLKHMLSAMLSGVKAQVAIKIFGPDLDILRQAANDVETAIAPIDGVTDLMVEQQVLIPNVEVIPKREEMVNHGVSVDSVSEAMELALGSEAVSRMVDGQYSYPIILRMEEKDRADLASIRNLYINNSEGQRIRLADVATVRISKTPNNINRENASRRIVVQHNVAGRPLGEVVADVEKALGGIEAKLKEMPGYHIQLSGQFEAQVSASRRIMLLCLLSLAVMLILLYMHFRSMNLSLQVLASIPTALIGAAIWLLVTRQTMSIATLVGLISLSGIAARNAILLLDHYLHLVRVDKEAFTIDMLVHAGKDRMAPVLMTALTSGIALVPLALSPGQPGKEILHPVASVIVGGLITSTLLDFIVRPALFWTYGRKEAERLALDPELLDEDLAILELEHAFATNQNKGKQQ